MPNAIDLFPQNQKVTHDPTVRLPVNTNNYIQPYPFDPAAQQAEFNAAIVQFVNGLKVLTGIDLTSFANLFTGINSQAGSQQFVDGLTNLGNLLNNMWTGLSGIAVDLGLEPGPVEVGAAQASQTAVLGAIARSVAQISAQLAANDPSIIEASDDFERVTSTGMGANWQIASIGGATGNYVRLDGHQLILVPVQFGETSGQGWRCRWIGTNAACTTDYMMVEAVIGTSIMPGGNFDNPYLEVTGRMNSTNDTLVAARLYANSLKLFAVNSGVDTQIGATQLDSTHNPGVGSTISALFGTDAGGLYQFKVTINGTTYTFDDSSHVSQVGSSFRGRGVTVYGGFNNALVPQISPAPVAHWVTEDVTPAPPPVTPTLTPKFTRPNYGALQQF
jgi:hypothetical protein